MSSMPGNETANNRECLSQQRWRPLARRTAVSRSTTIDDPIQWKAEHRPVTIRRSCPKVQTVYDTGATAVSSSSPATGTWTFRAGAACTPHRISLAAPENKVGRDDHAPARALALNLPPLHLLRREHLEPCPELLRLLPVPPDAPQRLRPTSVLRRPPPCQPQPGLVFQQARSTPVARPVLVRGVLLLDAEHAPLPCIALVLDQLFVYRVCDERDRLSCKPKFRAEGTRKLFWRER